MLSFNFLIILLAMAVAVAAQSRPRFIENGTCPDASLGRTFDANQFQGTWYRIGALRNSEEKSVNCTKYNYIKNARGYIVEATGTDSDGKYVTQRTVLSQPDSSVGRFTTSVSQSLEADMLVLQTNYTDFACLYTCYVLEKLYKVQFAWIISRERSLSKEGIASCQKILLSFGVPLNKLVKTDHTGCTN